MKLIKTIVTVIMTIVTTVTIYTTVQSHNRNKLIEEYQDNGSTLQGVIIAYNLQGQNSYLDTYANVYNNALQIINKSNDYIDQYGVESYIDHIDGVGSILAVKRAIELLEENTSTELNNYNINLLVSNQPKHKQKEIRNQLKYAINSDREVLNRSISNLSSEVNDIIEERLDFALKQNGSSLEEFNNIMKQCINQFNSQQL